MIATMTGVKRDMDLIREILTLINDEPKYDGVREFYYQTADDFGITGHSDEEVIYHLGLLIESGYVDGAVSPALPIIVRKLTMQGHDFLGSISDPGIWEKTKERLKTLPSVTLSIVAQVATSELKKHLNLP